MTENTNKVVVIYKSKYGSTKRYAQWIADEVNADLYEKSKISSKELLKYDTIVYGGSLYAVGILGIAMIEKNFKKLKDKKVIVFSVGASPAHPQVVTSIKENNFTDEMIEKIHFFHLRGAFNYNNLKPIDKFLMFMLKKKLEHKNYEALSKDAKGMLESYGRSIDWSSRGSIDPIIKCIKN